MSAIEDYGLLGDLQTAALVGRDGSIDWLCLPSFDSPACFAALLDGPDAGFWRLRATGMASCSNRRYRGDSLVLETEWETDGGVVRVIDFMPPRGQEPDVVRIVEGISGSVSMEMELRLRFDYGRIVPWVRRLDGQLVAVAGPDAVSLMTPVGLESQHFSTLARFTVRAGDRVPFVLTYSPSHLGVPRPVESEEALQQTESFWANWISALDYDGDWDEAVRRSLITLKALTYQPTGGIVAAATTSLPEQVGGVSSAAAMPYSTEKKNLMPPYDAPVDIDLYAPHDSTS